MRNFSSILSATALFSSLLAISACSSEPPAPPPIRDIPGVVLLDTADDGNNTPLEDPEAPAGFNSYGFWYTYDDIGSCRGTEEPNLDTMSMLVPYTTDGTKLTTTPYASINLMPFTEPLPNAPENTHGVRFSGGGQEYFGAGLGFKLESGYAASNNQGVNFVQAGFSGFRFWAYSSTGGGYIFKVQDLYSTPEALKCVPRGPAPGCVGEQNCENAPSITFNLAAGQWTYVEAYFGAVAAEVDTGASQVYGPLARQDWPGVDDMGRDIKSLPAAPEHVFQLQFQTAAAPGADGLFDLIIDNFGFIVKGGPADKSVQ